MIDSVHISFADVCGIGLELRASSGISVMELFPMLTSFVEAAAGRKDWTVCVSPAETSWLAGVAGPTRHLTIHPSTSIEVFSAGDTLVLGVREGASACLNLANRTADIRLQASLDDEAIKISATVLTEILRFEDIYMLHSAAVEYRGKALLLVAPSGGGKTTLASVWAAIGRAALMADDRCLLQRDRGEILCQGILGPVGLCRGSEHILSRLGCRLSPSRGPGQDDKLLYDPWKEGWRICRGPHPIGAVVLLTPGLSPNTRPMGVTAAEVHRHLVRGSVYMGSSAVLRRHFDLITDLVGRASLLRIPARPEYPGVVAELESFMGNRRLRRGRSRRGPTPPVLHRRSAHDATRQLSQLLLKDNGDGDERSNDDMHWKPILKLAEYHGLLPLLGHRLRHKGLLAGLSDGLRHVVKAAMKNAQTARLLHLHMIDRIGRVLTAVSTPWCIMKGPAIAERVYDPAAARPYADLDVIIPPQAKEASQEALATLGFSPSNVNSTLKHATNRGEFVLIAHDPNHYVVELHWDYVTGGSLRRFVSCDLRPVMERRILLRADELEFPAISLVDQFVECCVHAAYGHQWNSLRQLLDIILLRQHMTDENLAQAAQIADSQGVLNAVYLSTIRAERLFGMQSTHWHHPPVPKVVANRVFEFMASDDMTIRSWLSTNRFRSRLARTMLRLRWI